MAAKRTESPESNKFLEGLKVNRFVAYFDPEDFMNEIGQTEDPDVMITDAGKFDVVVAILTNAASGEFADGFQRMDVALIGDKTVVFDIGEWPAETDIFTAYEAHCSYDTFKKLIGGQS